MAVTVRMHDDVRKKKAKFIGPFTFRQALCLVLGGFWGYFCTSFFPDGTELLIQVLIAVGFGLPIILCGFLTRDGQYFEVLIVRTIYKMFLTPGMRKKKDLMYRDIRRKIKRETEKEKLTEMTSAERKQYEKMKKKGIISYATKKSARKMYR